VKIRNEVIRWAGAVSLLAAWLAAPAPALGAGPFEGAFVNQEGERLELRQQGSTVEGSVVVTGQTGRVTGAVSGGTLKARLEVAGVGTMAFTAVSSDGGLRVQFEGDDEISVFRRQPGAGPGATPPASAGSSGTSVGAAGGAPVAPAPQASGAAPGGRAWRSEYEGWGIEIPPGWKSAPRESGLVLGSDTEAGMILVFPEAVTEAAALQRGLGELLAGIGTFPAVSPLQPVPLPGGKGLWTDVRGTARDGTAIQVRAVAVVGGGGTVGVLGITTPDDARFKNLRQRVDAVARSVRFFAPTVSPARQLLVGEWWSYTSSSGLSGSGGTEKTLAFCPDGSFHSSSESSYSGGAGTSGAWGTAGSQRSAAQWNAVGDRSGGRITLTYPDGRTGAISYQPERRGDGMLFDGRLYGRTGERKYCR
jgi:hypothetical protein